MEFRSCRPEERLDAIRLSRSVFKDNMGEQFPVLFAPENVGRMLVAVDAGRVVSMVNYHFTPVRIGPATINVASVGSVCTDPACRGRGLASQLLKLAEIAMLAEKTHVVVISGEGGIYAAFGAAFAGDMREVKRSRDRLPAAADVTVVPYGPSLFPAVRRLYDAEPVRFLRKSGEFRLLIAGQTWPDTFATYPFRVVLRAGEPVAYAVLVVNRDDDELGVKEMAGDRRALRAAFPALLAEFGRDRIHFAAAPDDPILAADDEAKPIHQFASFKIVDVAGLARRLKPYFASRLGTEDDRFTMAADGAGAVFAAAGEAVRIADSRKLAAVVFGCGGPQPTGAQGILADRLAQVFPVPFPWTHSLNYQ